MDHVIRTKLRPDFPSPPLLRLVPLGSLSPRPCLDLAQNSHELRRTRTKKKRLLVLLSLLTVALAVPSQLAFNDASPSLVDSTSSDVQLLTQVDRELRWTYGNCGRTDDPLSIDEITTDRVPPEAGKPATFWVGGKFAKRIERGAYVNLSVERDLGDAVESRLDLCDEVFARKNWMVCPIEPDTFYFREEFTLPTDFWSSLIIEFDAYNRDGQRLGCAEIWFIYGKERLDDSLGSA